MSFSSSNFNKKLDSLQETQDSIVSISQWVLFHHRHCKELSELWSKYILQKRIDSNKKLSLLYLCNDVVQQAKHKRKPEFIKSFAAVLPNVMGSIYSSLDSRIQAKVDRLINVWGDRNVFAKADLDRMRASIAAGPSASAVNEEVAPTPVAVASSTKSDNAIVPELQLLNDLFRNMNRLIDISQANLNQVGIQSKQYLPADPSVSDNLPAPKIWIDKLNALEKVCQTSNKNIDDIKKDRHSILTTLKNLTKSVENGLKTDDSKKSIINGKLASLHKTRNELVEMVNDEEGDANGSPEGSRDEYEPVPPSYEPNESTHDSTPVIGNGYDEEEDDDDDDMLPTYEADSDEDNADDSDAEGSSAAPSIPTPVQTPNTKPEIELPASKRYKVRKSKSVAFSDNVEVKEYDQENQTEIIKIIKSDDDQTEIEDDDEYEEGLSDDFSANHKDAVELKHEHESDITEETNSGGDTQGNDGSVNNEETGPDSLKYLLTRLQ